MAVEERVTVGAYEDLVLGQQRSDVEGRRLALILCEVNDAQVGYTRGKVVEDFGSAICRSVVNGHDLEVRVVNRRQCGEGFLRLCFFIVAWDENRDRGIVHQRRWRLIERLMTSADPAVEQTAAHPIPCHDERIAEANRRQKLLYETIDHGSELHRERRGRNRRAGVFCLGPVMHGIVGTPAKSGAALALENAGGSVKIARRGRALACKPQTAATCNMLASRMHRVAW